MKYKVNSIRQLDQEMADLLENLIGRHYFICDVRLTIVGISVTKSGVVRVQNHHGGHHKLFEIQNDLVEIEVTK